MRSLHNPKKISADELADRLYEFCALWIDIARSEEPTLEFGNREWFAVVRYWKRIAVSISHNQTCLLAGSYRGELTGVLQYRIEQRRWRSPNCEIKKLLVHPRYRGGCVIMELLRAVEDQLYAAHPWPLGLQSAETPESIDDELRQRMDSSTWRNMRNKVVLLKIRPRTKLQINDNVVVVPTRHLAVASAFYKFKLSLPTLHPLRLGTFVDTGDTMILLQQAECVVPFPWPIVELHTSDVALTMSILKSRGVHHVWNGSHPEDERGIFLHPDGGLAAAIRDPDGHVLLLRESNKKITDFPPAFPILALGEE